MFTASTETARPVGTVARLGAAAAVLVSGLVHLQLYFDGYRDFPNENLGRSFLFHSIVAVVLVALLVLRRGIVVRAAAALLMVGALAAFAKSRTGSGIFDFVEKGFSPAPQAALAVIAEVVAVVLLAATFLSAVGPGERLDRRLAAGAAGAALVLAVIGAVAWAQSDTPAQEAGPASSAPATTAATTTTPPTTAPPTTVPATTEMAMPGTDPAPTSTSAAATTTVAPTTTAPTTTTTAPAAAPAADGVVVVSIVDFAFEEAALSVPVGTTVRWVNDDAFDHTVVAADDSFESETMDSGDTFEFTFTTAGEFPYVCGIHPSMLATVTVTA